MSKRININENDIKLVFEILDNNTVSLLHCQKTEFVNEQIKEEQKKYFNLVQIQIAGEDQDDHHGNKHIGTLPGKRLLFENILDEENELGRKITVIQKDFKTNLIVESHFQFIGNLNVIETYTKVKNDSQEGVVLTYISSVALTGLTKSSFDTWDKVASVMIPSNTWYGEFQWKKYKLPELGLSKVYEFSTNRICCSVTGSWSSNEHLPMGYIENEECKEGYFFSIINNGSWNYEISDVKNHLYIQLSGPSENENHWSKLLNPDNEFETVHTTIALTNIGFEDAVKEMTKYRRLVRRENDDNKKLPVIFNDFMNCLEGDPTAEKEYPLIDKAAECGCEYFTIDAGWYAQGGDWWKKVGEWLPSKDRFPDGLEKVLLYIREKGMIPGLWLELEVMGIDCPITKEKPDSWFFCRHGKRVIDHGRYQLDYTNKEVREFAHEVVRRLVEDYGAGYIKMDYNINAGIGTEVDSYSVGDGLLKHNRAYISWLDDVFEKYPDLIIENCGSGGLRINDMLLSKHSIQSSSDQTDYLKYAYISCCSPSAVTPEQNAVWSYPMTNADEETTAFNMVNAMMMRIHQSGHLPNLQPICFDLVKEGINTYKTYREKIATSYAFWPLGIPLKEEKVYALGLDMKEEILVAVWNTSNDVITTSLNLPIKCTNLAKLYPSKLYCEYNLDDEGKILTVKLNSKTARIFKLNKSE